MIWVAVKNKVSNEGSEAKALRDEMLKALLDSYDESQINVTAKGKPYLEHLEAGFSISHSDFGLLCAVNCKCDTAPYLEGATVLGFPSGQGFDLGADIEALGKRDIKRLLAVCQKRFSKGEKAKVDAASDKEMAVLEIWTRKEAYLKLIGVGLSGISLADTEALKNEFVFHTDKISLGGEDYILSICAKR